MRIQRGSRCCWSWGINGRAAKSATRPARKANAHRPATNGQGPQHLLFEVSRVGCRRWGGRLRAARLGWVLDGGRLSVARPAAQHAGQRQDGQHRHGQLGNNEGHTHRPELVVAREVIEHQVIERLEILAPGQQQWTAACPPTARCGCGGRLPAGPARRAGKPPRPRTPARW